MPGRSATRSKTDLGKLNQGATTGTKAKSASRRPSSEAAVEEQAARTQAPTSVQPVEPEDAYLTGVSRSLQRRLLGLNVSQAKPVSEASAPGIHSTGSYIEDHGTKTDRSPKTAKDGKKK
jgi:hypothetical protein